MIRRQVLLWSVLSATLLMAGCGGGKLFKGQAVTQPPKPLAEFSPTLQIKKLWSTRVGDGAGRSGVRLAPAYADGKIFAASTDGKLVALDATTGKVVWKHSTRTGDGIWPFRRKHPGPDARYAGGPVVYGTLLVVGTQEGHVYGYDATSGKRLWEAQVDTEVIARPSIDAGTVYVRTQSGHVYALDGNTGKQLWLNDEGDVPLLSLRGNGPPLSAYGIVLFGTDDGTLVSLRGDNGSMQWQLPLSKGLGRTEIQKLNDADGGLALDENTLYATAFHGELTAVNPAEGRALWSRPFSSYVGVGVTDNALIGVDDQSLVWGFSKQGGGDLWKQDALQYHWLTAATIQGSHAVVGGVKGYVHWLQLSDGKLAGRVRLSNDPIRAQPVVQGDTVYVEDVKGHLAAYRVTPISG